MANYKIKTRYLALFTITLIIAFFVIVFYLKKSSNNLNVMVIHPFSYSNIAIFQATLDEPTFWSRRAVADTSKHSEILKAEGTKRPIIAVTPFTNALLAANKNRSIRIIGGAGLNGLYLVARNASSLKELNGKKIGTARADTLELMLYEAMNEKQYRYESVYFDDPFVAIDMLKKGKIDALTHVQPFVSQLINKDGMNQVLSSKDFWGDHPDAVIMTTEAILKKYPKEIESALQKLIIAERKVNKDPHEAAKAVAPFYEPITVEQLTKILPTQRANIDIRPYMEFFKARYKTLLDLHYIEEKPFPKEIFDFDLLTKALQK